MFTAEGAAVAAPPRPQIQVQPLHDRVVIRPLAAKTQTEQGLHIPDIAQEVPQQGRIIAVGPGRVTEQGQLVSMVVKEGDHVLYSKYSGTRLPFGGEEYLVVRESDVLAVLALINADGTPFEPPESTNGVPE